MTSANQFLCGLAMIPAVNKPGHVQCRCVTRVTKNWYFKTGLVSSKIADDGTSQNLPGAGRGLSPLSLIFSPPERPLLAGNFRVGAC